MGEGEGGGNLGDFFTPSECYGWAGTILRVNLTTNEITRQPLPEEWKEKFLGGRNLNSKILFDEVPPGADALGPENRLIIGTGPLTGVLGPATGRFTITAKSPLTGIHGDSNAGGDFGPEMKYAGYDHLVISGKAENPVYLWIDNDHVEIRDASHLWGKTVFEADKIIKMEDIGDLVVKTLIIGPAGENLVRFACPIASLYRAPGRCGMGAVMGSKNLKAIVVRGNKSIKVAKPKEYLEYVRDLFTQIYQAAIYPIWSKYGTTTLIAPKQQRGEMSVRNQQEAGWVEEKAKEIYGDTFINRFVVKSKACFSCPVHCAHGFVIKEGPYASTFAEGMEWGTIGCFGDQLDNPRLDAIGKAHELSSQYGMDTMSTGLMIAFAMELFQRKILTEEDTGGIELNWGDYKLIVELVRKIAYREEGIGDLLAEGKRGLIRRLGERGAEAAKYANQIKGLDELTDFRSDLGRALNYSTSTRGADHLRGLPTYSIWEDTDFKKLFEEKYWDKKFKSPKATDFQAYDPVRADIVIFTEMVCDAADTLEVCKFNTEWMAQESVNLTTMAKLVSLVTGWNISSEKLREILERGWQIERAFSAREGISAKDDIPYPRSFEPIPSGPQKGKRLDRESFEKLLQLYYERRGWNSEGIPTRKRLESLGLKEVADQLDSLSIRPELKIEPEP
jgi:aldehyde:ferredoxin oxidoreductase